MSSNQLYECQKCHNILLYSNKFLHDLKCTKNRPVMFSLQNPVSNSRYENYTYDPIGRNKVYMKRSPSYDFFQKINISNDDGTTTEIKKDTNMFGKEELVEIKYDPQGNIIGRKRANGGKSPVNYKFHDILNYRYDYTPINYYLYEGNNLYVKTEPYEINIPRQNYNVNYGYQIKNNNPQYYGSVEYPLKKKKIYNASVINLNKKNPNNINNISYNNIDLNRYFWNSLNNNSYDFGNNNNNIYNNYNYNYYYNQNNPRQNIRVQNINISQNQLAKYKKFAKVKKLI